MNERKECIRTQVTPDGLSRMWKEGVMTEIPVLLSPEETTILYNSRVRASAANKAIEKGRS